MNMKAVYTKTVPHILLNKPNGNDFILICHKSKKNIFHAFYSTLASQTLVLNKIYSEECDHLNYSLYSISLYLKCFATSFVFSKYEHISQMMTFKKMCSL